MYIYICMCACMNVKICLCAYVCGYLSIRLHLYIHNMHIFIRTQTYTHVRPHTNLCIYIETAVYLFLPTYLARLENATVMAFGFQIAYISVHHPVLNVPY